NRWQKIVTDDFGRKVPQAARMEDLETGLLAKIRELPDQVGSELEACRFKAALGRIMDAFRECNRYIDTRAPWTTRKSDMAVTGTTIHTCIQAVRTLGVVLEPFLPFAAEKIRVTLGLPKEEWVWAAACEPLPAGHALGPAPEVLFKKLDPKEFAQAAVVSAG
ncbi:MAG TPA: class I tRNA ligase family protein, partial [Phycisphaerae bacterium]|nr:class I tRNA ligase family protein [Phycisphaerae bacterium]